MLLIKKILEDIKSKGIELDTTNYDFEEISIKNERVPLKAIKHGVCKNNKGEDLYFSFISYVPIAYAFNVVVVDGFQIYAMQIHIDEIYSENIGIDTLAPMFERHLIPYQNITNEDFYNAIKDISLIKKLK